jgi:hypothetical protein
MKKSDYAIVISCNPGYGYGMLASMNAQNFFKTDADWEIAYEDYTEEERNKITQAFPFNVNWTSISELMRDVVDKRTDKSCPLNRFWLAYWLLAHKLLKEKKYKAVCVIQADQFVFVNLDCYFKAAEAGIVVTTEYAFSVINPEDLPFGDDKAIWNRCQCGMFDGVNFIGQQYTQFPMDIVHYQEEDAFKDESNHSVICLNRAACKHLDKKSVMRLERHTWMCDASWHTQRFHEWNNRVYNDKHIQINGWHCRWWQIGRAQGEWEGHRNTIKTCKDLSQFNMLEHNILFIKAYMDKFHNMIPEIKSIHHATTGLVRPKYELENV